MNCDFVDPSLLIYARRCLGKTTQEISKILNTRLSDIYFIENSSVLNYQSKAYINLQKKYKKEVYNLLMIKSIL